MQWLFMAIALVAGALLAVQVGLNSSLGKAAQSPVLAAFISFLVGGVALLAVYLLQREPLPEREAFAALPWWTWTGGLLGAFYVAAATGLAPKMGGTLVIGLAVAGQLICSVVLDHFGFAGFPQHVVNPWRLLGVVLLIAGVVLIKRF